MPRTADGCRTPRRLAPARRSARCLLAVIIGCSALNMPALVAAPPAGSIGKNHIRVRRWFAPVIEQAARSTIRVFAAGRMRDVGLAVALTGDGYLISHAELPAGELTGQLPDGGRIALQRVARIDQYGIAILRAPPGSVRPMAWWRRPPPPAGSLLLCAGRGAAPVAVGVAGLSRADREQAVPWLEHDLLLRPNDCGGPVVDTRGRAVGVSVRRAGRGTRRALPTRTMISAVRALVDARPKLEPLAAGLRQIDDAGDAPGSVPPEAVRQLESRMRDVAQAALAVTVRIRMGTTLGSGVLISPDGFVLTAAHVSQSSGRVAEVRLADGRRVTADSRGADHHIDLGLLKIRDPGPWPHVTRAALSAPAPGQWCLASGHPVAGRSGRPAALRAGKVLRSNARVLMTDCTLGPGDSGGPLLDLHGALHAIHIQAGEHLAHNTHVPVRLLPARWQRLVGDDVWGREPEVPAESARPGYLGVGGDRRTTRPRVHRIHADSPAQRAGLRVGDEIHSVADQPIDSFGTLTRAIRRLSPGSTVALGVRRTGRDLTLFVTIGAADDE